MQMSNKLFFDGNITYFIFPTGVSGKVPFASRTKNKAAFHGAAKLNKRWQTI